MGIDVQCDGYITADADGRSMIAHNIAIHTADEEGVDALVGKQFDGRYTISTHNLSIFAEPNTISRNYHLTPYIIHRQRLAVHVGAYGLSGNHYRCLDRDDAEFLPLVRCLVSLHALTVDKQRAARLAQVVEYRFVDGSGCRAVVDNLAQRGASAERLRVDGAEQGGQGQFGHHRVVVEREIADIRHGVGVPADGYHLRNLYLLAEQAVVMTRIVGYHCRAARLVVKAVVDTIDAGVHLGYGELFPYVSRLVCLLATGRHLQHAFRVILEVRHCQRLGSEVAQHGKILAVGESPRVYLGQRRRQGNHHDTRAAEGTALNARHSFGQGNHLDVLAVGKSAIHNACHLIFFVIHRYGCGDNKQVTAQVGIVARVIEVLIGNFCRTALRIHGVVNTVDANRQLHYSEVFPLVGSLVSSGAAVRHAECNLRLVDSAVGPVGEHALTAYVLRRGGVVVNLFQVTLVIEGEFADARQRGRQDYRRQAHVMLVCVSKSVIAYALKAFRQYNYSHICLVECLVAYTRNVIYLAVRRHLCGYGPRLRAELAVVFQ